MIRSVVPAAAEQGGGFDGLGVDLGAMMG